MICTETYYFLKSHGCSIYHQYSKEHGACFDRHCIFIGPCVIDLWVQVVWYLYGICYHSIAGSCKLVLKVCIVNVAKDNGKLNMIL